MWGWLETNWTNVLVLLAILVCPLMHTLGHGRHLHESPNGPEARG